MRRKDREVTLIEDVIDVIKRNKVLRMAMVDGNVPYIIPLNYGYTYENDKLTFFFHCAKEGRKLDILRVNNNICFEIDSDHQLITADSDCYHGYKYASVIGIGKFFIISDDESKVFALSEIMKHQTGCEREFSFVLKDQIIACRLDITSFTGKARTK